MPYAAQRILIGIVAVVTAIDVLWGTAVHFDVDIEPYVTIALIAGIMFGGAYFYDRVRGEHGLGAMLFGVGFYMTFSASCALFNYFALTITGPRIDDLLASLDRAMGFDWLSLMSFMANHPFLDAVLKILYLAVLPQIVILTLLLAWRGKIERIYGFCLSMAIGAMLTVSFWTLFPSFGAFSVYSLPAPVAHNLSLVLDKSYAQTLVELLRNGPGHIVPADIKGLVGFPSYHAVLALLVTWYVRDLKRIGWAAVALNLGVLIATPIQGGHHVVDLAGGLAVTVAAIALSGAIMRAVERRSSGVAVTAIPLPTAPRAEW